MKDWNDVYMDGATSRPMTPKQKAVENMKKRREEVRQDFLSRHPQYSKTLKVMAEVDFEEDNGFSISGILRKNGFSSYKDLFTAVKKIENEIDDVIDEWMMGEEAEGLINAINGSEG